MGHLDVDIGLLRTDNKLCTQLAAHSRCRCRLVPLSNPHVARRSSHLYSFAAKSNEPFALLSGPPPVPAHPHVSAVPRNPPHTSGAADKSRLFEFSAETAL